jgi:hypothetical protein
LKEQQAEETYQTVSKVAKEGTPSLMQPTLSSALIEKSAKARVAILMPAPSLIELLSL